MNISSILQKLGGRKFVGWLASTVALIFAGVTGNELSPEVLTTLVTIFGIFVSGNALEHGAEAIGTRRSRLHLAAETAKADGKVGDE